ncbi:hypothetical protein BKA65DRAFT_500783 [Rhexocercosporidium sp. MPI-PUGE-AT-0058]|nr:hypothetical protein BKA65DRAFT_500783 [Rhexocercosporidium sp. MPI-PUGE-AT-0058]
MTKFLLHLAILLAPSRTSLTSQSSSKTPHCTSWETLSSSPITPTSAIILNLVSRCAMISSVRNSGISKQENSKHISSSFSLRLFPGDVCTSSLRTLSRSRLRIE